MSSKRFAFVVDIKGKKLAPTPENNAWYLIRKGRAKLLQRFPMVIELQREIPDEKLDNSKYIIGIDDGSKHVGISIIQKCKYKTKTIFKGTLEQRNDVTKLISLRRSYRRYRRGQKRYRPKRFNNRSSSKRKGRIPPSIKQKKDAILRVVNKLNSLLPSIYKIFLEDVAIDIRVLQEGKKLYGEQYKISNKLDENIRKAVLIRDKNSCMNCGRSNCNLEVHHIIPKRMHGNNTIDNLISLCEKCHKEVTGQEFRFINKFQQLIKGKNIRFDYAQHVMQGKTYLRNNLRDIAEVILTTGGDTANKRINLNIEKSHSNDAVVIAGGNETELYDWFIKPLRKKSKSNGYIINGFRCRDAVKYTKKNGESYVGYITSLDPKRNTCNITTFNGLQLYRYGIKRLILINHPKSLMWS